MKNKKFILSIIVGLGVLAFLLYYVIKPEKISVEIASVKRGTFEDIIKSDGRFRSKEKYLISAYASGTLSRVTSKVGDNVKKGQKLAVLEWDYNVPIKSPIDGVVAKVFRESAGPINRGDPIIEIVNPKNLEIVAEVLTTDAVRIRKGNLIRIENWGGKDPLEAEVSVKSAAGYIKLSTLGVEEERTEVIAKLKKLQPETFAQLGDNYHVELTIVVSKSDHVLKVPIGSLFKDGENWAVYKVVGNKARLTTVKVSNKNFEEALIESGLGEGDKVILHPGDLIKEGTVVFVTKNIN